MKLRWTVSSIPNLVLFSSNTSMSAFTYFSCRLSISSWDGFSFFSTSIGLPTEITRKCTVRPKLKHFLFPLTQKTLKTVLYPKYFFSFMHIYTLLFEKFSDYFVIFNVFYTAKFIFQPTLLFLTLVRGNKKIFLRLVSRVTENQTMFTQNILTEICEQTV